MRFATLGFDVEPRCGSDELVCWLEPSAVSGVLGQGQNFISSANHAERSRETLMTTICEAQLLSERNLLIAFSPMEDQSLVDNFFGSVVTADELPLPQSILSGRSVCLCGDISKARNLKQDLAAAARVFVVGALATGYDEEGAWPVIDLGRGPINVHGAGVYYRRFFDGGIDHFSLRGVFVVVSIRSNWVGM